MATASEIREWLDAARKASGLTIVEWAKLSGINKATIHRALSPSYEFTPSMSTIIKLIRVATEEIQSKKRGKELESSMSVISKIVMPLTRDQQDRIHSFETKRLPVKQLIGYPYLEKGMGFGSEIPIVAHTFYPSAQQYIGFIPTDMYSDHYNSGTALLICGSPFNVEIGSQVIMSLVGPELKNLHTICTVMGVDGKRCKLRTLHSDESKSQEFEMSLDENDEQNGEVASLSGLIIGAYRDFSQSTAVIMEALIRNALSH